MILEQSVVISSGVVQPVALSKTFTLPSAAIKLQTLLTAQKDKEVDDCKLILEIPSVRILSIPDKVVKLGLPVTSISPFILPKIIKALNVFNWLLLLSKRLPPKLVILSKPSKVNKIV